MKRTYKALAAAILVATLAACGGGGGSGGTSPNAAAATTTTTTTTPTAQSLVADFAVFTDKTAITNNGSDSAKLTVVAVDANRNIVSGTPVTVAITDASKSAFFVPGSTSTDRSRLTKHPHEHDENRDRTNQKPEPECCRLSASLAAGFQEPHHAPSELGRDSGEAAAALGSNRLHVWLPYLDRRMLVDAGDLQASPDRSGRIDEHDRTIAVERLCQRHNGVQPGAVEEGKQSEIEMHVALGSQVDQSFLEKRGCSEIKLSVQAQAGDAGEGRNLEHRHGIPPSRTAVQ